METSETVGSDTEVSPEDHSKLLTAISQLDNKQRVKPPCRKEPSLQVSEFHLVQSGEGRGNAVHILDLAKALKTRNNHVQISRKLKAIRRKGRTLPKPLEKPVAERIQRSVGYKKVKKQAARWEPVVQKNRVADHISFPLSQGCISLDTTREFFTRFKTQSPLEAQVAEILSQSKCAQEDREKAEKEFPLSIEELAERRKEMAKLRSQQSYEAAKARRQGRIKSKKYHRVLRREKMRKQLKDFETLQKTDPEAALEQLQQLERARAKERMTLRHRNTGQWAHSKAVRAKYDPQSRQALAEQLAISRDLTKKLQAGTDSSEEEADDDACLPNTEIETKNNNPWITPESEVQAFVGSYKRFWEKYNKDLAEKKMKSGKMVATQPELPSNSKQCSNESDAHQEGEEEERCSDVAEELKESSSIIEEDDNSVKRSCLELESNTNSTIGKPLKGVTLMQKKKETLVSPMKLGNGNSSVKISATENVKRKRGGEPAKELADVVDKSDVKGTSSWTVTPIKLTNDERNLQESIEKLSFHSLEVKKRKKQNSNRKQNNSKEKVNETVLVANVNEIDRTAIKGVHVEDLFDSMEQKLKQKISNKIIEIKRNMKRSDNLHDSPSKYKEDAELDESYLELKRKAKRPQEDAQLIEELGQRVQNGTPASLVPVVPKIKVIGKESLENRRVDVDPNKFLSVKPKLLLTQLPDMMTAGEESLDNEVAEENQQMTITEAFTGDDVVTEFAQEKAHEEEKSKPKEVDLTLPGWGSWGGKNLHTNRRKKRRFIINFPKAVPRRDENKGHLIINEDKDTKILQHQVSEVPFPFTTVKDFEASIRAPIGNTWVPETAHRKLIEPQVKTKLGTIIPAMDEETLVNKIKKVDVT